MYVMLSRVHEISTRWCVWDNAKKLARKTISQMQEETYALDGPLASPPTGTSVWDKQISGSAGGRNDAEYLSGEVITASAGTTICPDHLEQDPQRIR